MAPCHAAEPAFHNPLIEGAMFQRVHQPVIDRVAGDPDLNPVEVEEHVQGVEGRPLVPG